MHKGPITSVLASHDGRKVFTGGYDKAVFVWDRETGTAQLLGKHAHLVNSLALSMNGKWLASSSSDYKIHLYNVENNKLYCVLHGHSDDVEALSFAADDTKLISTSRDRRALVWDIATGRIECEFHGHSKDVLSLWVEGEHAFTTGDDGRALVWNYLTGELVGEIGPFDCELDAVSGNSKIHAFAIGADDGRVMVYDSNDLTLRMSFQAHERGVKRVAFSPSGTYVLTAGYDHLIKIWSTDNGELLREMPSYKYQWERSLSWGPDEQTILGASFGVRYCEWDLDSCALTSPEIELATPSINDVAVSQACDVATASDDGRFRLNGEQIGFVDGTLTNAVGISEDGRFVMWGDHASCVHLVDRKIENRVQTVKLGTGPINSIFYNQADSLFYVGTYGGYVHLVDPNDAVEIDSFAAHEGAIKSVQADEQFIATCSSDGSIYLYNKLDKNDFREFVGPNAIVNDLCLDGKNNRLVAVSRDKIVRLFDLVSGKILAQHDQHRFSIKSVVITQDGQIISGDYWGHVVIWDPNRDWKSGPIRISSNGISALRNHPSGVYAASYSGQVYRINSRGEVETALELFDQEALEEGVGQKEAVS